MARIIQFGPARATGAVPPAASVSHPVDYPIGVRFVGPARHVTVRPSIGDRIASFIESPFAAGVYVGIYLGIVLTVAGSFLVAF